MGQKPVRKGIRGGGGRWSGESSREKNDIYERAKNWTNGVNIVNNMLNILQYQKRLWYEQELGISKLTMKNKK